MKDKKTFNLLSCVFVKKVIFLKGILGGHTFWFNLPCLDPFLLHYISYQMMLQLVAYHIP
jgi:hypothetical protein